MIIGEIILTSIVDAVFEYMVKMCGDQLGGKGTLFEQKSTRKAFQKALKQAFYLFSQQCPDWVHNGFDAGFFQHEGAAILAQFLIRDGCPDASALACCWADSLNLQHSEQRAFYTRELEPVAARFLEILAHELKSQESLSTLHDSRAFEQLAEDVRALRQKLDAQKATPGTRRDYLKWLIDRNLYIDPRGTMQTQRQVQVRLDEVYISLKAQRQATPGATDQHLIEKELSALEAQFSSREQPAEEYEDQRELLLARLQPRAAALELAGESIELAECVQKHDRLVILGDPGSGKTTLLRYLALTHAQALYRDQANAASDAGKARFPIYVRIAEYAEDGRWKRRSLSDFLAESYRMHECPENGLADLIRSELERGESLILLDGLDEIVSSDERRGVVQRIEDFVRRYCQKANRFVLTSRIAGYRSAPLGGPFVHYVVQDMDKTQIRRFLEKWCQAVEDAQTPEVSPQERERVARREIEGIMRAVKTSPGVRRLATNPLLLWILALIHRTGARLPQKRIELYKLATEVLARTWRSAQGVPESALVRDEYLIPLLSKLAYWLHVNKPTGIATESEVHAILGEEWAILSDLDWNPDRPSPKIREEVSKFLLAVREHTGLFVERAPKRYGFMHLTFEEYYAARYLVASSKTRAKQIREHLHDPRWEEPILLALGFVGLEYSVEAGELVETAILARGKEAQVQNLKPSKYENLLGRDYLFALRCLGDAIPVSSRLQRRLMERLAGELLHEHGAARYTRYRRALFEKLPYVRDSEALAYLLPPVQSALQSEEVEVRWRAAESLGRLGEATPEVLTALQAALQHDADREVRSQAAISLGWLKAATPEVLRGLQAALQHDAESVVRWRAAESLGRLGEATPEVLRGLQAALQHDAEWEVRRQAAESLGGLGEATPEVLTALQAALQHDAEWRVRRQAAESLGWLKAATPEVLTALQAALQHDAESVVRQWAAISLGWLGQRSPEILAAQMEAVRKSKNWWVRRECAELLGHNDQENPQVVTLLWSGLLDEDTYVRRACAKGLAQQGRKFPKTGRRLETRLIRALQDPKFDVPATNLERPAWDSVYDALWLLVIGEEEKAV
jgi:HEAT repeat protein/energy-coupling factor transporter ATP-binding protein EcfA2